MAMPYKKYIKRPSAWSLVINVLALSLFVGLELCTPDHGLAAEAVYCLAILYFTFRTWVAIFTWKLKAK